MNSEHLTKLNILVVDDEYDLRTLLNLTLTKMGMIVSTAQSIEEAMQHLKKQFFDLVLTDMRLPDGEGLTIVKNIQEHHPNTSIAVLTAYSHMDNAINAMKMGAFEYLSKPVGIAQLRTLVQTVLEQKSKINLYRATTYKEESKETPSLKTQNPPPSCHRLLGTSQAIRNTREIIQKIAPTQASVYIYGESGTGKEQAARMIHELSGRSGAFVPVNCGAIPEQLMESEFFGYKRGAFTGADRDHTGFFQQAHGGTLFLDEVADLPLSMQVKLLRAIQENTIRRLGHHKEEEVDTRIISASHKDIASMVEHELFRQDLYYRLNVIPIKMPPLRDMSEDILDLVNHILKKHQASSYILNDQALLFLKQYHFPGNVRELENMIERAIIFSKNHQIRIEDFSMNHVL